jgi:hypothetical protein
MNRNPNCFWLFAGVLVIVMMSCASTAKTTEPGNNKLESISFPQNPEWVTQAALYIYDVPSLEDEETFNDYLNAFRERYIISALQYSFDKGVKPGPAFLDDPDIAKFIYDVKDAALRQNITIENIVLLYRSTTGGFTVFSFPVE